MIALPVWWGLPIAFILGAVGRRVAGGWVQDITGVNTGDMPVRAFYGFLGGVAAMLCGLGLLWALAMAVAVFAGSCMGTPENGNLWHAAWHGFLNHALPAVVLALAHYYAGAAIVIVAGTGGASLLLKLIRPNPALPDTISWLSGPPGVQHGTQLWELAWGGIVFFSMAVGIYIGPW